MLPSGNDAALTLAENIGQQMRSLKRICPKKECKRDKEGDIEKTKNFGGNYIDTFVKEMNRVAKNEVHLRNTSYNNPHGLADRSNYSTAFDQAILSAYCMKIPEFAKIINTKQYSSTSYLPKVIVDKSLCKIKTQTPDANEITFETFGKDFVKFSQTWHNSNKLLGLPGFCGVKTGITSTAGSCLAVYFKNQALDRNLITVVLGSRNIEYRWKDTRRLTLYTNESLKSQKVLRLSPRKKVSSATPARFERSKLAVKAISSV